MNIASQFKQLASDVCGRLCKHETDSLGYPLMEFPECRVCKERSKFMNDRHAYFAERGVDIDRVQPGRWRDLPPEEIDAEQIIADSADTAPITKEWE